MKRSTKRILTTHTGSLPRPKDLVPLIMSGAEDSEQEAPAFRRRVAEAVEDAVRKQVAAGVDVVSDGEMGKPSFYTYVVNRVKGFGGTTIVSSSPRDLVDFLEPSDEPAGDPWVQPGNDGPISYSGHDKVATDIANLRASVKDQPIAEAFLPAVSPGCVAEAMATTYYPSDDDYLVALADALREEYRAIVDSGLLLQVDCPDLALGAHLEHADLSIAEYRGVAESRIEVLNHALKGIDPERVRVHVCWGNYVGPHHHDIPLREIIDLVYKVNAQAISVEGSNPRHQHEWKVFAELPLPEGKILIPGVIDTGTVYVEHPEVVADRILRYASVVRRENVIAGTDCGFGTMAAMPAVTGMANGIAFAKLASLVEGARIASRQLWG